MVELKDESDHKIYQKNTYKYLVNLRFYRRENDRKQLIFQCIRTANNTLTKNQ